MADCKMHVGISQDNEMCVTLTASTVLISADLIEAELL